MTLYLVINEGSGKGAVMTLANNEQHAIDEARGVLGYTVEERGDLRSVSKDTAEGQTRALLALWEGVAVEAMGRGYDPGTVERELRSLDALLVATLTERDREIKRAAAEEREACAARLSKAADLIDALAADCPGDPESQRTYSIQSEMLRAAITSIRSRGDVPARSKAIRLAFADDATAGK